VAHADLRHSLRRTRAAVIIGPVMGESPPDPDRLHKAPDALRHRLASGL
jgi:hypothetical protein